MRKVVILGCVTATVTLGAILLRAPGELVSCGDSPAFQVLLGKAISRLEGIPQQVTAVSVSEARAEVQQATISDYTCSGFRTCDGIVTCDGTATCDGEETCWASTCLTAPTCEATCSQYTVQGGETCDGSGTCEEACPGWPTYYAGWPTCTGEATCELSCPGYVSCSGCNATERTTWGHIKAQFR